ncbi:hypothetical protein BD414DRAFT_279172 [Trametes punicea]|nr:hypothetical protein BD414DRAFT_279172 [Trametes punicea]
MNLVARGLRHRSAGTIRRADRTHFSTPSRMRIDRYGYISPGARGPCVAQKPLPICCCCLSMLASAVISFKFARRGRCLGSPIGRLPASSSSFASSLRLCTVAALIEPETKRTVGCCLSSLSGLSACLSMGTRFKPNSAFVTLADVPLVSPWRLELFILVCLRASGRYMSVCYREPLVCSRDLSLARRCVDAPISRM